MKKIKYVLMLVLLFFITGCSNYNMSMKIDKDKSMQYTVTILSDNYDSTLASNISAYKEKYEQYGYSVEEYNANNQYGMIISKKFPNLDDISNGERSDEFNLLYLYTDGYNADVESKMFNVDKGMATNRYAANFYVDLSNLGIDLNNATVTYVVELPKGSLSNNATTVSEDGKTLTWNITSLGKTEIDYVFEVNSYDNVYYIVAILIAVYLFFSIISNLFKKGSSERDSERRAYSTPVNIDKKIENLTNNAINNNANKNVVVNKNNTPSNVTTNYVNTPGPIKMVPPVIPVNTVQKDDMTSFKTPDNQKKKGIFGMGGSNKNNNSVSVNKVNDNEEFNQMINNMNNNVSYDSSVNINNTNSNEQIPNPFGTVSNANNVNINSSGSVLDWYDNQSTGNTSNNINDLNSVNTSENNNISEDGIISVKPILNTTPSVNEINDEIEKVDNTNKDINSINDSLTSNQNITFQSLNNLDNTNNSDNESNNDGPVIRVNSKSIVVDNSKNENL